MANDEHLKIIREGVDVWNQWREENREIRPDLSNANLIRADLRSADLTGADVSGADLSGADLSGAGLIRADLIRADFIRADLRSADLSGADLSGADISHADLIGADLTGANLTGANLYGAGLRGANLRDANLIRADLRSADLIGADFEGSVLGRAGLGNVDLCNAVGLATVLHHGPSSIGTDALERTAASLGDDPSRQGEVEAFLRGAGVKEDLLDSWRGQIGQPIEFYSAFISYDHADKDFARRLYTDLQMKGIRCWLDEHELLPGDDIYRRIDRGIRIWDKTLLCCSEAALTSWWVDNEIATAFDKEQKLTKERREKVLALIPLNLDGYLFSGDWESGKATQVKERLAADFRGWASDSDKYNAALEKLVDALRPGDAGRKPEPEPKL